MCRSAEEYPPNGKRCGFGIHYTSGEQEARRLARNAREKDLYYLRKNREATPVVETVTETIEVPVKSPSALHQKKYNNLVEASKTPTSWAAHLDLDTFKEEAPETSQDRVKHMLSSVQDDLAYVDVSDEDSRFNSSSTNAVNKFHMKDGRVAYFKSFEGVVENGGVHTDYSHDALATVANEVAVYQLSQALGDNYKKMVPTTVVTVIGGLLGTLQEEAEGNISSDWMLDSDSKDDYAPDFLRRAALFDYIAGSQDRHALNYSQKDKGTGKRTAVLIDNGFSFPEQNDSYLNAAHFQSLYQDLHSYDDLTDEDKVTLSIAKKSIEPGGAMFNYLSEKQRGFMADRIKMIEETGSLTDVVEYGFNSGW